jgi:hypothetical protein
MTEEELIAWMRERGPRMIAVDAEMVSLAADRIEQLNAKLASMARVAKPFSVIKIKNGMSQPGEIGKTDVTNLRATLAELKGQKDD